MTIPVAGVPLTITRTYDSRIKTTEDFGYGWTLGMSVIGSVQHNRKPGDGWRISKPVGFHLPCSRVEELKSHVTEVRLGERTYFRFKPVITNVAGGFGFCDGDLTFEQTGGTRPGAKLQLLGRDTWVFNAEGRTDLRNWDDLDVEAATDVRLTTPEGNVIDLNVYKGVTRFQDRNGNAVSVGTNGLAHNLGIGLPFERDAEGRITKITDPMGYTVQYRYDGNGDLVRFEDQERNGTEFRYIRPIPHHLEEIVDALRIRSVRIEYDLDGRNIAVFDAQDGATRVAHELEARRELLTDALGGSTIYEYDRNGNVTSLIDAEGSRTEYEYDDRGNQTGLRDHFGRHAVTRYDAFNRMVEHTDFDGHLSSFSYNERGDLLTAAADGQTTRYEYSEFGNLLVARYPNGAQTQLRRNERGQVVRITSPAGATTDLRYSPAGAVVEQALPSGLRRTYEYDANGRPTKVLESPSTQAPHAAVSMQAVRTFFHALVPPVAPQPLPFEIYSYDGVGRITSLTDASGSTFSYQLDALGRPISMVMPSGARTNFEYDVLGRQTALVYSDGTRDQFEYDAVGSLRSIIDRDGVRVTFETDSLGRQTRTTYGDGTSETIAFDEVGRILSVVDRNGVATSYSYSPDTQYETDAAGNVWTYRFDASGMLKQLTDPLGESEFRRYDGVGNLVELSLADGASFAWEYDGDRKLTTAIGPLGETVELQYDDRGLPSRVVHADGSATSFSIDGLGQLVESTAPDGQIARFEYDASGRLRKRTSSAGTHEFAYSSLGDEIEHVLPSGTVIAYEYDDESRMLARSSPLGRDTLEWSPGSRLLRANATTFQYDWSTGNLAARCEYFGCISYHYYGSRVSRMEYGNQVSTLTYNELGRLAAVGMEHGPNVAFAYDAVGNRNSTTYSNGIVEETEFDAVGNSRMVVVRDQSSGVRQEVAYVRDLAGRVTDRISTGTAADRWKFRYDHRGRLLEETHYTVSSTNATSYSYDLGGNRRSKSFAGGQIFYDYDFANRLTTTIGPTGTTHYSYDADGSLVQRQTPGGLELFTRDSFGRLLRYEDQFGRTEYEYDFSGLRVGRHGPNDSTTFLYDSNRAVPQLVLEQTGATTTRSYLLDQSTRVASTTAEEGFRFLHQSVTGSVESLTDASGGVTDTYQYDAFGNVEQHVGTSSNRATFMSEQQEIGGTYYLRARDYDPAAGRFTSTDPLASRSTSDAHAYAYAGSDPVNNSDPLGLFLIPFLLPSAPGVSGNNPRPTHRGWLSEHDANNLKDHELFRQYLMLVTKLKVNSMHRVSAYTEDWFGRDQTTKVQAGWKILAAAFSQIKLNPGQGIRSDGKLNCVPRAGDPLAHLDTKKAKAFVLSGSSSRSGLYLCDAFWDLPIRPEKNWAWTKPDSAPDTQMGTLVHEASHFKDATRTLDVLRDKGGIGSPGAHRALALESVWELDFHLKRPRPEAFYREAASWEYHFQSQLAYPGPIDRRR